MEPLLINAYSEGKKLNHLLDDNNKILVGLYLLGKLKQGFEHFSYGVLMFYRGYDSELQGLMKQVNEENMMYFGTYFIIGLLSGND